MSIGRGYLAAAGPRGLGQGCPEVQADEKDTVRSEVLDGVSATGFQGPPLATPLMVAIASASPPFLTLQETEPIKKDVSPAGRHTVALRERRFVMAAVVGRVENQPVPLQPPNNTWRTRVVSPLVKLIRAGCRSQETQQPGVTEDALDAPWGAPVPKRDKQRKSQQEAVPVQLTESM